MGGSKPSYTHTRSSTFVVTRGHYYRHQNPAHQYRHSWPIDTVHLKKLHNKRKLHNIDHMIRTDRHHTISNHHIHSGYRDTMSIWECICSTLEMHNETLNIWTHIIGIFQISWMFYKDFIGSSNPIFPLETFSDVLSAFPAAFHLICWLIAFVCSIGFHILRAHLDARLVRKFLILDYLGVYVAVLSHPIYFIHVTMRGWSILHIVWAAIVSAISYKFFQYIRNNRGQKEMSILPYLAMTQISGIILNIFSVFCVSCVIYLQTTPNLYSTKSSLLDNLVTDPTRSALKLISIASAFIPASSGLSHLFKFNLDPLLQHLQSHPISSPSLLYIFWEQLSLRYLYWKGLVALFTGALCFHYNIPEVFIPGKFDHFGHSHILHHLLCMVVAHCSYTDGVLHQIRYIQSDYSSTILSQLSWAASTSWSLFVTVTDFIINGP
jgi:predicted membrane channel-forming protein YqfA (hemolysin III family)